MNIAALMGASGIKGELTGSSKSAVQGLNGEFKQVLQGLITAVDEQSMPVDIAAMAGKNGNWLGSLLKLFDQNAAPGAASTAAEEALQSAPETTQVSLTEIMTTLQTLVNQNDAEALINGTLTDAQAAADAVSDGSDSSEIEPADLANQSQVLSVVPATTRQPLSELSPTSIDGSVTKAAHPALSATANNGAEPMATTHPGTLPAEKTDGSQTTSQATAASQAKGGGANGASATAASFTLEAAAQSAASPANQGVNTMSETSARSATPASGTQSATPSSAAPAANTQTAAANAAEQTPAAETLTNSARHPEAVAEGMKAMSPAELSSNAKGTAGDTAEVASPVAPTDSQKAPDVAPVRGSGSTASGLPNVPALNQIMESIKLIMQKDETQVRMQLHPKELGQVLVQLHINDGKVSVHLLAENSQAQSLIQSHLPQLKEALAAQGLQIDQASIDVGSDTSAFDTPHQHSHNADFHGRGYQQNNLSGFNDTPDHLHPANRSSLSSLYAVDYQV